MSNLRRSQRIKSRVQSTSAPLVTDQSFIERLLGVTLIINPDWDQCNWDQIELESCNDYSQIIHDKKSLCQFASIPFIGEDTGFYCAAKFESTKIYDISTHFIMDTNDWYRHEIIRLASSFTILQHYLECYIKAKIHQISKQKKSLKKLRHRYSLNTIEVSKLIAQYGVYLGFLITLNNNSLKAQQWKSIKVPSLIFKKQRLLESFCSKASLQFTKNGKHFFNVNEFKKVYQWLIKEYVMKCDIYGFWNIIQIQLTYIIKTQMLMIKYDVMLTDKTGHKTFIFRDINAMNPNYLEYKKFKVLVFGYIRESAGAFIPIVLMKLCLDFRYDADEYA